MKNIDLNAVADEHDEHDDEPRPIDGQLSFDGTEYREQLTPTDAEREDAYADFEAAGKILVDASKDGTREDVIKAADIYDKAWTRLLLTEDHNAFLLFYAQLLLNNPICGTPNEIAHKIELIEKALPPDQRQSVTDEANKIKALYINAGKLQARAEAVKDFITKELQKENYHGEDLNSLLYDRDPAALADPEDEKTGLLLQAIAAAERAAHQPHEKLKAADRKEAAEKGAIFYQPKDILSITDTQYKGGISFYNNAGSATLALLRNDIDIQITQYGRLSFPKIGELSEIEIENTITHEQIESINLPLLRVFYTYIVQEAEAANERGDSHPLDGKLTIDVGTLAAELGESRPTSKRARDKVIAAAKSFHNIAGKLVNDQHATPSYYQVLNFEKYESKSNTITLRAPYLAYLFQEVYKNNLRLDEAGHPQRSKTGNLLTSAYHGYGIQNELVKKYGRNKAVLENLFILDSVIEAAGKYPNITAREIINRNIYLSDLLKDKNTHDANQTLKRIFSQTWRALKMSDLVKMYDKIALPDPDDPRSIPTTDTLDVCYRFKNSGKKKTPRK